MFAFAYFMNSVFYFSVKHFNSSPSVYIWSIFDFTATTLENPHLHNCKFANGVSTLTGFLRNACKYVSQRDKIQGVTFHDFTARAVSEKLAMIYPSCTLMSQPAVISVVSQINAQ